MSYRNFVGTKIARDASEPKTTANVAAQVDNQPVTALSLQIVYSGIQFFAEGHPESAGEVHDFKESDIIKLDFSARRWAGAVSSPFAEEP